MEGNNHLSRGESMNFFKFYPVGQGLFYAGALAHGDYNFVYDCGTKSGKHYMNSSIESYVTQLSQDKSKTPMIDFVVISHLHKDHFSGLYDLSQHAIIKNVYLPYLGKNEDFIAMILAKAIASPHQHTFSDASNSLFHHMLGKYMESRDEFTPTDVDYANDDSEFAYFKYEKTVEIGAAVWKFVFLNRRIAARKLKSLIDKTQQVCRRLGIQRIADLVDKKGGIREIAKIYSEVFQSKNDSKLLNMTSTLLIHFPLYDQAVGKYAIFDRNFRQFNLRIAISDIAYSGDPFGCMPLQSLETILTGDAILDNQLGSLIKSHLSNCYNPRCGVLQVPHHGSYENWKLWKKTGIDSQIYAIPYGEGNQHKHPSTKTINDLIFNSKRIQLINQLYDFEYYITLQEN